MGKNKKSIILIYGLPGSGKTTFAKTLQKELQCVHINADVIRQAVGDWEFSEQARNRQHKRLKLLSEVESERNNVIVDFVCPFEKNRMSFGANLVIFIDTIESGRYENTNKIFERGNFYDFRLTKWNDTQRLIKEIMLFLNYTK